MGGCVAATGIAGFCFGVERPPPITGAEDRGEEGSELLAAGPKRRAFTHWVLQGRGAKKLPAVPCSQDAAIPRLLKGEEVCRLLRTAVPPPHFWAQAAWQGHFMT